MLLCVLQIAKAPDGNNFTRPHITVCSRIRFTSHDNTVLASNMWLLWCIACAQIAKAPDGNGGLYRALQSSGTLAKMQGLGLEALDLYCVDNILARLAGMRTATIGGNTSPMFQVCMQSLW
jgi:hypothetical protein